MGCSWTPSGWGGGTPPGRSPQAGCLTRLLLSRRVNPPLPHPRRLAPSKQWTVFRSKGNTKHQSEESNWRTNENARIRHKRCLERREPKIHLKADFDFVQIPVGKMAAASSEMAKVETKSDTGQHLNFCTRRVVQLFGYKNGG